MTTPESGQWYGLVEWSDGYGDIDPDLLAEQERVLIDYEAWLHSTANACLDPTDPMHEDLVQEARIAIWRALERFDRTKGALPSFVTQVGRWRMLDLVSRRSREVGHEAPEERDATTSRGRASRDKIREYLRHHPRATGAEIAKATGLTQGTVSLQRRQLDLDVEHGEPVSLSALLDEGIDPDGGGDPLDDLVDACVAAEVRLVLDMLTPKEREYVRMRFWEGLSHKEMTAEFGYNPGRLWTTAKARIAPVLADLLADDDIEMLTDRRAS